jgi:PAS domain S-box-containing protein
MRSKEFERSSDDELAPAHASPSSADLPTEKEARIRELEAQVAALSAELAKHQPKSAQPCGGESASYEQALQRSDARFRDLAEALPQHVYELDGDGNMRYANGRLRAYFGTLPVSNADRVAWVHPADQKAVFGQPQGSLQPGCVYESEGRLRRFDGEYRWFLIRAVPIFDAAGKLTHWFGFSTDIHELKQAQEQLRQAERRTSDFLAVLSHELRNPLAPISNGLHILTRAIPGSEAARKAQAIIGRQVGQLTRLVEDLLDLTRISRNKVTLQREYAELHELVQRTLEDYRSLFDGGEVHIELTPAKKPVPVFVYGDRNRLAQVVGNLLHNAAKFTGRGGRTQVSIETDEDRKQAIIRVLDTGVGIAPEMLDRLFQPFVQADTTLERSKGGLGLGLALIKKLVELHGGTITAASDGLGKGAEFVVRLPLVSTGTVVEKTLRPSLSAQRRRILVIEDNVDAADSLRTMLELWGHTVAVALDGPAGLKAAREFRPEVVLCDIGLPGMDGCAVARAIRSDKSLNGPFLVSLSGYAQPTDVERATEAGFDRHLAKPANPEKLAAVLESLQKRSA